MMGTESGEFSEKTLFHEGNAVREFYASYLRPVSKLGLCLASGRDPKQDR